jgi:hypothetical protein
VKPARCPFPSVLIAEGVKFVCPACKTEWFIGRTLDGLAWLTLDSMPAYCTRQIEVTSAADSRAAQSQ